MGFRPSVLHVQPGSKKAANTALLCLICTGLLLPSSRSVFTVCSDSAQGVIYLLSRCMLAASACCGIGGVNLVSTCPRGGHQPKVVLLARWSASASCTVSKPSRRLPLSSLSSWLPWPSSGRQGTRIGKILAQGSAFPQDIKTRSAKPPQLCMPSAGHALPLHAGGTGAAGQPPS